MFDHSRTLILARHAKSSWASDTLPDHDRPLNERGIRDAPRMARRLRERGTRPQAIVTSSAVRALATAEAFAAELELEPEALQVEPAIYGAGVLEMISLIHGLDDGLDRILLVGHNPTFSELAGSLAKPMAGGNLGSLPTCAVVTLGWDGGSWNGVDGGRLDLVDLDYPKRDEP